MRPAKDDDVYQVTLDKKIDRAPEYVLGTFFYHIDRMPFDAPPPYATLLSARRIAPVGGHTEFANTDAAWEHLPCDEKERLKDLKVIHSVSSSLRDIADPFPRSTRADSASVSRRSDRWSTPARAGASRC